MSETAPSDPAPTDSPPAPAVGFAALGLLPAIVRNLERAGYRRPWPVQSEAIPPAMAGRDVIGLAPTGRGKTMAFAAPIADAILRDTLERSPRGRSRRRAPLPAAERIRGLVLCPTRELAVQVARDAEILFTGTRHTVLAAYGKVSINPQIAVLREGCDLLVATPGRLRELLQADALTLAHVDRVAVDDVDRMLDMGFLPQVRWLLERLPADRRTSFFTATMPEAVAELVAGFLRDPVTVEAGRHTRPAEHVRQVLLQVADRDKVRMLLELFGRGHGLGTLVFCGTRRGVGWVGTALERQGIRTAMLHGDRSQRQRETALQAFEDGEVDVLVCTDVAARGLHLERVRTVINYDVPNDREEYVHRVGRAGHGGGHGEALTLVGRLDEEKWEQIAWSVAEPLPYTEIEGFEASRPPRSRTAGASEGDGRRSGGSGGTGGRGRRGAVGRGGGDVGEGGLEEDLAAEPSGRTYHTKKASRPGRNRSRNAAKPIPRGQKPGGGVKQPDAGAE